MRNTTHTTLVLSLYDKKFFSLKVGKGCGSVVFGIIYSFQVWSEVWSGCGIFKTPWCNLFILGFLNLDCINFAVFSTFSCQSLAARSLLPASSRQQREARSSHSRISCSIFIFSSLSYIIFSPKWLQISIMKTYRLLFWVS